jgi:hypothetical protein
MDSIFCLRCLTVLKSVMKVLFHLDAPLGYQDDTGFHHQND